MTEEGIVAEWRAWAINHAVTLIASGAERYKHSMVTDVSNEILAAAWAGPGEPIAEDGNEPA